MKRDLIILAVSAIAGMAVGFAMSIVGTGVAMAETTASRDALRDKFADQMNELMASTARDLAAARTERGTAMAALERAQPKSVKGDQ